MAGCHKQRGKYIVTGEIIKTTPFEMVFIIRDSMTKWDKIFRIAVVLLLSANLAVSSMICVRLGNGVPAASSGDNISATETVDTNNDSGLILPPGGNRSMV